MHAGVDLSLRVDPCYVYVQRVWFHVNANGDAGRDMAKMIFCFWRSKASGDWLLIEPMVAAGWCRFYLVRKRFLES